MTQPTASKTALLLGCQRPFAPDVEADPREPSEAANYGSAFHECMHIAATAGAYWGEVDVAPVASRWAVDGAELRAHVAAATAYMAQWLAGENIWGETFRVISAETPRALNVYSDAARPCEFRAEDHHYSLEAGEIGGTDDLLVESANRRAVIDYKTGDYGEFSSPETLPQMLTLGLMTGADATAILHTPRGGLPPVMYAASFEDGALTDHLDALRMAMGRIGDGSLRPGGHCKYCPAGGSCPAKQGEMIIAATALVRSIASAPAPLATNADKGRFHLMLAELERLAKAARAELRQAVRDGEVIQRPDGKVLALKSVEVERLSKGSIVGALGKLKGEAMLEKLRKLGCLQVTEHEELRAVNR